MAILYLDFADKFYFATKCGLVILFSRAVIDLSSTITRQKPLGSITYLHRLTYFRAWDDSILVTIVMTWSSPSKGRLANHDFF